MNHDSDAKVYRLNDKHEVVEESDFNAWAEWMLTEGFNQRRVDYTTTTQAVVSTVFLGTEHLGGLFETMVFYSNW